MTAVITVNEGEYGVACVFYTAYDMSTFTTLQIQFTKPVSGDILLATATCPNVDVVTALGTFLANEYAQYFFVDGDLDELGVWYARVIYTKTGSPNLKLISNSSSFEVTA